MLGETWRESGSAIGHPGYGDLAALTNAFLVRQENPMGVSDDFGVMPEESGK